MVGNISILHILPHCGGGVGTVLRALLEAELKLGANRVNIIACLEYINDITKCHLNKLGIPWIDSLAMKGGYEKIANLVKAADIVLVHWWNHPFLMHLLFRGIPRSRMALWSHVNGFSAPQSFFPELFELPDRFIFATKASLQSPIVEYLPNDIVHKLRVIRSCAGIPNNAIEFFTKDEPFQFGYVGTVEPAKMHPDFLKLCAGARISSKCIVAGGPAHDELRWQAERLGISNKFAILGHVENTVPIFRHLHTFAYPLNPVHYGSGEQVLIEAMAYGAVPVVLSNPPEKALIQHKNTGLVAHNAEEFTNALRMLADNPAEQRRLSAAGREFVFNECNIKSSVNAFSAIYEEMLSLPKCLHKLKLKSYDNITDGTPFHLFLASCDSAKTRNYFVKTVTEPGNVALPYEFRSATRGTPQHYLNLLGDDSNLQLICQKYQVQKGTTY
ncbi:MAG: glycosyltransferase family 4 protein [Desulfamplus sp.]|nr:glycosyltransferase family 4 protein [Desulfamplus sp.]